MKNHLTRVFMFTSEFIYIPSKSIQMSVTMHMQYLYSFRVLLAATTISLDRQSRDSYSNWTDRSAPTDRTVYI